MASPNAVEVSPSLSAQAVTRLVEQFRCLAEVAEQLTYRLVDLEERLAEQQQFIMAIRQDCMAADHGHPWQERLDQTDLRLAQIETPFGRDGGTAFLAWLFIAFRSGAIPSHCWIGRVGVSSGLRRFSLWTCLPRGKRPALHG